MNMIVRDCISNRFNLFVNIYIYIVVNDLVLSLRYTVVKASYLNFQQDRFSMFPTNLIFFSQGDKNKMKWYPSSNRVLK